MAASIMLCHRLYQTSINEALLQLINSVENENRLFGMAAMHAGFT